MRHMSPTTSSLLMLLDWPISPPLLTPIWYKKDRLGAFFMLHPLADQHTCNALELFMLASTGTWLRSLQPCCCWDHKFSYRLLPLSQMHHLTCRQYLPPSKSKSKTLQRLFQSSMWNSPTNQLLHLKENVVGAGDPSNQPLSTEI